MYQRSIFFGNLRSACAVLNLVMAGLGALLASLATNADTVSAPLMQYGYGQLWCTAISPDGAKMLSGSADGKARLWDLSSGKVVQTFSGHKAGVGSVAFSPDGTKILTGSSDGTAKLWDARVLPPAR